MSKRSINSVNEENEEEPEVWIPLKQRKLMKVEQLKKQRESRDYKETEEDLNKEKIQEEVVVAGPKAKTTLIEQKVKLMKQGDKPLEELQEEKESELINHFIDTPLMSVQDRAAGVTYQDSIETGWYPPRHIEDMDSETAHQIRKHFYIKVAGDDIVNPITRFEDFKFPRAMLRKMREDGIETPSAIQIQALGPILSGRDIVGIASTGSGKTLAFAVPMVLMAIEEELKLPVTNGEGPFGLVVCPSRELAKQIFDVVEKYTNALEEDGWPAIKSILCIGGVRGGNNEDPGHSLGRGCHIVVATPGRLQDLLKREKMTLNFCKYFVLDEADRMIDMGFEEDVRNIMDYFQGQRQTLLFSATMPTRIHNFAKSALVRPIEINTGLAGAANLNVIQEIEYVPQENRVTHLLTALQKTPPPVLIFCENKNDVDDIHHFLLIKGVEAAAVHGGRTQEERSHAIKMFKDKKRDVLIATDVASKGLDFPLIAHVILFDMPKEIENYVHRIGRTGRGGNTGIATTFVNKNVPLETLMDLKHLLREAKQNVPQFLSGVHTEEEDLAKQQLGGIRGCSFCGGLGHRITNCPKMTDQAKKQMGTEDSTNYVGGDY